tara:strand:+ start:154 stop:492 length:339 start_codon:yes stop_codon:yes gene_type:complete
MAETNSPQYIEARQAWWDKRDQYNEQLKDATCFFELEKALFLEKHLDPELSDVEDDRHYGFLKETHKDAEFKVLEICSDFANKKVSLDLAREEMKKAEKAFYDVKHSEKEVA